MSERPLPMVPTAVAVWWRAWKTEGIAATTSLLFNGGVLLLMGLLYFYEDVGTQPLQLHGTTFERRAEAFEVTPVLLPDAEKQSSDSTSAATCAARLVAPTITSSLSGQFALPSGVSGLAGSGSATGRGHGHGLFSGVSAAGSFAYVVDASGSMEGGRMKVVLNELARSVSSLNESQKFFVIFFSDRSFPMMWPTAERELVSATSTNRNRILQWAFSVRPAGGTEPQQALRQALELKPDVLYFLTDGSIPPATLRLVEQNRRPDTIVNTICVGNRQAADIMKQIATIGGGEFVAVR
ncbi:MAG: hypothetical protein RIK87_25500 [Fuerstiella sp.]